MASASHPYYPQHIQLDLYEPNRTALPVLLLSLCGLLALVQSLAQAAASRLAIRPLNRFDRLVIGWFILCGSLHCFFEGYFILNHGNLAASQSLFGQLWKEYALSDSRYLTSDPFMICVETITALAWGPLCFLAALCIAKNSPAQYALQAVVSVAHLYGVVLYYATCYVDEHYHGRSYSRPEFLYSVVYFVGFNAPWVVIPSLLLKNSLEHINSAVSLAEESKKRR